MNQLHKDSFQGNDGCKLMAILLVCMMLVMSPASHAQVTRHLQNGNSLYGQKRYKEAAVDYAKAVAKNPTYTPGLFNLGNSLYQQKQFDSSRKVMETTAKVAKDKGSKAAANYNIGNTYMSQQKWEDAINSYKHTLRNNPQDADAKYNLSYAEQMLKKQQQEDKDKKDKQDKDKKEDKDKKDDKDKNDDKDKKDDKDQQNKDQQDKDKKEDEKKDGQPQGQPSKLSPKEAERLLNALQQEEKKLQEKMKKEKGVPVKLQKDW
jgi:tetratricopeptide (TPR) repeat protein